MRKTLFASAIFVGSFFVFGATSCSGSGSAGTGGTTGSGSGGASGTGGTKGTASGGASGSGAGGTAGTDSGSGNSGPEDASTAGLMGSEFTSACKACLADKCFSQFSTCEMTKGCIPAINCIATCYHSGKGNLEVCGMMCQGDAGSSVVNDATEAVTCAAIQCGTEKPTPCPT